MKILITGIAGFIGSHVAEAFAEQGHEVFGVDNFNDYYDVGLKRMNAADVVSKGVKIIEANLHEDLSGILPESVDYIFHFAAQPGISASTSFSDYQKNNVWATHQLLEWTKKCSPNVKLFVNISTSSVYGRVANLKETELTLPVSNYGVTKLAGEQLALAEQRSGTMKACSLRLYSVYGPRERPEKLYTKLIKSIYEDLPFPLFEGSEKHSRSFTFVGDIVAAMLAVIGKEEILAGEIINIGSSAEHTTKEGIELIEKIIGKKAILETKPPRPGDQLRTTAIIDKAEELLGYSPNTSFEEGLRKQVAWYTEKFIVNA
ncbi:Nucleoside-diphosphate-sugar epimerase [Pustulibacterium marinum]|uniref:Nucleoside-diphosphate-sugar epimerase n=1 Tax=Pustulibacterium marinum TaxID=1224947 RepID=A0A1I7HVP4_9FLAO|nr:NAD-dependent epimerase/dehydratase family protein [Pustulibacterium marinum]SFU64802.1 Nucleoside-diphosphate-sugar epimerase [Pustulibacterium marinum]